LPDFDDELLLQRCEPGVVLSCAGATTGDRFLGLAVSRYERTWPAAAGNVSASMTVPPPRGLAEAAERLVQALGWRGLFEIELIQHADGSMTAIDFNPRIYGSLALSEAAGAPLAALWCDWLTRARSPAAAVVARPGVRYRWEEAEARNVAEALSARRLWRVWATLRPRRKVARALFRRDDPGPLLARAAFLAARLANRAAHRLKRLPPPGEEALSGPPSAMARSWETGSVDVEV
jgi:predicted ATP-grasp superfamily ATP-dependent carboligase